MLSKMLIRALNSVKKTFSTTANCGIITEKHSRIEMRKERLTVFMAREQLTFIDDEFAVLSVVQFEVGMIRNFTLKC